MRLRDYLKTEGISQKKFAERIGVSQGLIWQWLNDRCRVAAERVLDVEKATSGHVMRHEVRPDLYPKGD